MNIICVDDEELVLGLTVSLCEELPQKPVVQGFQSAEEALGWLKIHKADIALLDINMPDMDGLTLAARVKELRPDMAVIFLTGYAEYAVDAFKLHASGYLMKPVSRERLAAEVEYALSGNQGKNTSVSGGGHVVVQTFGEFDVLVDGRIVSFSRSRSKELLAYLVDRQGGSITRAAAFAVLYEDAEYDRKMQKQLDVIIRSLRATLEEYGIGDIFELKNGAMRVLPEKMDCDLYRFLDGDVDTINTYRGEYMSAYSWASLTEAYVERLNNR